MGRRAVELWEQAIMDWAVWMHGQGRSPLTVRQWGWILRKLGEDHLRRSPWKLSTEDLWRWYGPGLSWAGPSRGNTPAAGGGVGGGGGGAGRGEREPPPGLGGGWGWDGVAPPPPRCGRSEAL